MENNKIFKTNNYLLNDQLQRLKSPTMKGPKEKAISRLPVRRDIHVMRVG